MMLWPVLPPKVSGLWSSGELIGWESRRWISQDPAIAVIAGGITVAFFRSINKPAIALFVIDLLVRLG